jgi:hypothetical protein
MSHSTMTFIISALSLAGFSAKAQHKHLKIGIAVYGKISEKILGCHS